MKIFKSASPELIIFLNENASKYEYGIDTYYSIYFGLSEENKDIYDPMVLTKIKPKGKLTKCYWVESVDNQIEGELVGYLTLGTMRCIKTSYLIICQDSTGKLFDFTEIIENHPNFKKEKPLTDYEHRFLNASDISTLCIIS